MHSTKSVLRCSLCASSVFISMLHRHATIESSLSPYILAELPSNLILRKIGPTVLMPTLLTAWGLIVILQGGLQPLNDCDGLAKKHLWLGLVRLSSVGVLYSQGALAKVCSLHLTCLFSSIMLFQELPYSFLPHRWVYRVNCIFLIPYEFRSSRERFPAC